MASLSLWQPNHVYRAPLARDALQSRILQEATRLRDAFPTRGIYWPSAGAHMVIPYLDGFDLIHVSQQGRPDAWLAVKVEANGAGTRLHVSRRRRPRPERMAFVIAAFAFAVLFLVHRLSPDKTPLSVPFFGIIPFAVGMGVVRGVERWQERRLLMRLSVMFPEMSEESAFGGSLGPVQ